MAIGRKPSGAYDAAFPVTMPDGSIAYAVAVLSVDQNGNPSTTANSPTGGTNLSGTATTTSGGYNIPANANRKPGDVQGQNVSGVTIGYNEFGGTAAIGAAGTYAVAAGATFSITTNQTVNFVAASGSAPVTVTGL